MFSARFRPLERLDAAAGAEEVNDAPRHDGRQERPGAGHLFELGVQPVDRTLLERRAAHISRSRQFASLSDSDLRARWRQALTSWSHEPANDEWRRLEDELQSELLLQGVEPPDGEVAEELQVIAAASRRVARQWSATPEGRREMGEAIMRDIDDLEAEKARPNRAR